MGRTLTYNKIVSMILFVKVSIISFLPGEETSIRKAQWYYSNGGCEIGMWAVWSQCLQLNCCLTVSAVCLLFVFPNTLLTSPCPYQPCGGRVVTTCADLTGSLALLAAETVQWRGGVLKGEHRAEEKDGLSVSWLPPCRAGWPSLHPQPCLLPGKPLSAFQGGVDYW